MIGRLVIDLVHPRTASGTFPAKATVGEPLRVEATIFADGHDVLGASAEVRPAGDDVLGTTPADAADLFLSTPLVLVEPGVDRWEGFVTPLATGPATLIVSAWRDHYRTWRHRVEVLEAAGQLAPVELEEGARLLERYATRPMTPATPASPTTSPRPTTRATPSQSRTVLTAAAATLRDETRPVEDRLAAARTEAVEAACTGPLSPAEATISEDWPLFVDRALGGFSAWYELFPRSVGGSAGVVDQLPRIAAMGFDVLYLPPIHPIGRSARKGRGNTLVAGPDDPGSPWAIGGPEGGHEAIHPDLGTLEDFTRMVEAARAHGIEVALDYALQCSPDHPWLDAHPEWFRHRADGSIAYAENPPKKYQDIVPLEFWPEREEDRVALWEACLGILETWIDRGVTVFRVDNPHTKPVAFWAWLIGELRAAHPEVVLLAEAFTRPPMMAKLAEVGFTQSYTYFTWRTSAAELAAYGTELATGPAADYLRPNLWPNTPDILSGPLRRGPRAAFALRAVLAATMSPNWGIYSGYELGENEPASEANEEYADSEKYAIRRRDFDDPSSIAPLLSTLNQLRRRHPALQRLAGLAPMSSNNPAILAYGRATHDRSDVVLVVVNLDPERVQEATLGLDLAWLGLDSGQAYVVTDELAGVSYTWEGPSPYVRLDPAVAPAHVFCVRPEHG
jgi:starch synthase (maltosyl-transferring)